MRFIKTKVNGININIVQTTKFKSLKVNIAFNSLLETEKVTERALMPYIMKSASNKYKTRQEMSIKLEEMYSASLNIQVMKLTEAHIIAFDISTIDNHYTLNNENIFEETLDFLNEIIYNPLFEEKTFIEEKRLHQEYLKGLLSNKMKYAIKEHRDIMFEHELYKVDPLGTAEKILTITNEDIISEYNKMIKNDKISITIIGNISEEEVLKGIKERFKGNNSNIKPNLLSTEFNDVQTVKEVIKVMDVNQAKLCVGYRLNILYNSENYYKALLFNLVLGGTSESMLFDEIREQSGLVYFINSSYSSYKGALFIYAGINQDDYDKVMEKIDTVLQNIKQGIIPEDMLEMAKNTYVNGLRQGMDSIHSLSSKAFHAYLFNYDFDVEKIVDEVQKVTIQDITDMAALLTKDTVYLLRGEPNEKN